MVEPGEMFLSVCRMSSLSLASTIPPRTREKDKPLVRALRNTLRAQPGCTQQIGACPVNKRETTRQGFQGGKYNHKAGSW